MVKNYTEYLRESAIQTNSIVCLGLDPVIEKIPLKEYSVKKKILDFYSQIIEACVSEEVMFSALKPNYAFFAQYGFEGLEALKELITDLKKLEIPVILDVKRGDISTSQAAYAKEIFSFWNADAATINPLMGFDTVEPFINLIKNEGKGIYLLNRTSNKSAAEIQNEKLASGKPVYMLLSEKIAKWANENAISLGAVVGATSIQELNDIAKFYAKENKQNSYFLIPGVGSQGGSAKEVVDSLQKSGLDLCLQRINSSSAINYAYEKFKTDDFAGAAVRALRELNREIGFKPK